MYHAFFIATGQTTREFLKDFHSNFPSNPFKVSAKQLDLLRGEKGPVGGGEATRPGEARCAGKVRLGLEAERCHPHGGVDEVGESEGSIR